MLGMTWRLWEQITPPHLLPIPFAVVNRFYGLKVPPWLALLLLNGTISGVFWAVHVGGNLTYQRQRGLWHLATMAPVEERELAWGLSLAMVHDLAIFHEITRLARRLLLIFISVALILWCYMALSLPDDPWRILPDFVAMMSLVMLLYLDHVQASVLGILVGLAIPRWVTLYTGASAIAGVAFTVLHLTGYIIWFMMWRLSVRWVSETEADLWILIYPLALILFYVLREMMIRGMWRILRWYLS